MVTHMLRATAGVRPDLDQMMVWLGGPAIPGQADCDTGSHVWRPRKPVAL